MEKTSVPTALRIVAVLFLISGWFAVVEVLVQLTQRNFSINLGVLGIPIYFGLMRLSGGWRICALAFIWLGMLLALFAFIVGVVVEDPAEFAVWGVAVASVSSLWISVLSVALFVLCLWQYRALTRPEIRELFIPVATPGSPDAGLTPAERTG